MTQVLQKYWQPIFCQTCCIAKHLFSLSMRALSSKSCLLIPVSSKQTESMSNFISAIYRGTDLPEGCRKQQNFIAVAGEGNLWN